MTKVKICGLSRPEDIEAVNAYGADYAGFVFFEKSKRNVGYEKAEKLLRQLKKNPNIQSVAVCVRRAVCAGAKHQRLCGRWG